MKLRNKKADYSSLVKILLVIAFFIIIAGVVYGLYKLFWRTI